jgi:DNA-directed RNA polymerase subunit RPC12/RpoP
MIENWKPKVLAPFGESGQLKGAYWNGKDTPIPPFQYDDDFGWDVVGEKPTFIRIPDEVNRPKDKLPFYFKDDFKPNNEAQHHVVGGKVTVVIGGIAYGARYVAICKKCGADIEVYSDTKEVKCKCGWRMLGVK